MQAIVETVHTPYEPDPEPDITPDCEPVPLVRTREDELAFWRVRRDFTLTYLNGSASSGGDDPFDLLPPFAGRLARLRPNYVRTVREQLRTRSAADVLASYPEEAALIVAIEMGWLSETVERWTPPKAPKRILPLLEKPRAREVVPERPVPVYGCDVVGVPDLTPLNPTKSVASKPPPVVRTTVTPKMIAEALRIAESALSRWRTEYTPESDRDAPVLEQVARMLRSHPELRDPAQIDRDACARIGLDVSGLDVPWRWKQVECRSATEHSTGRPLRFWTPIYSRPQCPSCCDRVPTLAVGPGSYRIDDPPPLSALDRLSVYQARVLVAVARAGETTTGEVCQTMYHEIQQGYQTQITTTCRLLTASDLLTMAKRRPHGRTAGALMWYLSATEAGRAAVAELAALKGVR